MLQEIEKLNASLPRQAFTTPGNFARLIREISQALAWLIPMYKGKLKAIESLNHKNSELLWDLEFLRNEYRLKCETLNRANNRIISLAHELETAKRLQPAARLQDAIELFNSELHSAKLSGMEKRKALDTIRADCAALLQHARTVKQDAIGFPSLAYQNEMQAIHDMRCD
jgi:hypothetical protein